MSSPAFGQDIVGRPVVVDGDTLRIGPTRIRLEGIDAPETDQVCDLPTGQRWPCGQEARRQLAERIGSAAIACEPRGEDIYGRTLALCRVEGEDVGAWMVRNGWALSFVRYSRAYDPEEAQAREAKAGLWRGTFVLPWKWRQAHR